MKKILEVKNKKLKLLRKLKGLNARYREDETSLKEDMKILDIRGQLRIINWLLAK